MYSDVVTKGEMDMALTKKEKEYLHMILKDIEENSEWYAAMSYVEYGDKSDSS